MDDWQLIQCYGREDSQDAFTEIVRHHVNLVYSAALRQVREVELAETRSAHLTIVMKLGSVERTKSVRARSPREREAYFL